MQGGEEFEALSTGGDFAGSAFFGRPCTYSQLGWFPFISATERMQGCEEFEALSVECDCASLAFDGWRLAEERTTLFASNSASSGLISNADFDCRGVSARSGGIGGLSASGKTVRVDSTEKSVGVVGSTEETVGAVGSKEEAAAFVGDSAVVENLPATPC